MLIFTYTYPIFHSRHSIVPKTLNLIPISPFITIPFQLTTDGIVIRIDEQTHFTCTHNIHSLNIQKYSWTSLYKNLEFHRKTLPACRWIEQIASRYELSLYAIEYHVIVSRDDAICIARAEIVHETAKFKYGETLFYYLLINIVDTRDINKCIRNVIPWFLFFATNSLRFLIFNSDTKLYTTYLPLDFKSVCIEMKRHSSYECKKTSLSRASLQWKWKKNINERRRRRRRKKKENSKRRIVRDFFKFKRPYGCFLIFPRKY